MQQFPHARGTRRGVLVSAALGGLALACGAARAQLQRTFPGDAKLGAMAFSRSHDVTVDGKAERLGPGVRVNSDQGRVVFPSTLAGQTRAVRYQRDAYGKIFAVWVLTPTELAREREIEKARMRRVPR